MDLDYGLPSFKDRAWGLSVTDPPYGIKYKKPSGLGENPKIDWDTDTTLYDDSLVGEAYYEWCTIWMDELLRVADNVVFTPGNPNLKFWLNEFDPYDILVWIKRNTQSGGKGAWLLRHEFILIMRKNYPNKYTESIFDIPTHSGFLTADKYIHPAPKTLKFWKRLIMGPKPRSVVDPFLGSGTTAQICEQMGIPWVGYEKMEAFAPDIDRRIKRGIKDHQQQNLMGFINGNTKN